MGVLDTQSIREHLANRKLGKRRLDQRRDRSDVPPSERRRPSRGLNSRSRQDTTIDVNRHRRVRRGAQVGRTVTVALAVVVAIVMFPIRLIVVLVQPRELARRLREAPTRMRRGARRVRMASRDPDSTSGRVWETARLSAWFVREEFADMQDGFPRPADVAASALETLRDLAIRAGQALGLIPDDPRDDVGERLFRAAALGVIASSVLLGLFVASFQGIEALKSSDRLAIADIQVQGLDRTVRDEVLGSLSVQIGDNLLELEPSVIATRAQDLAWVDTVTVRRDLRSQALVVQVVEHRAALILAGDPLQLVDDRGRAFKALEPSDPADLPILTLNGPVTEQLLATATVGALEVLGALAAGRAIGRSDVSELTYDSSEGFVLITRGGLPVRLGRQNFADRLGRLERAVDGGGLPLDALASVDIGLRDRLVAVPLTTKKARKTIRQRVDAQPVDSSARRRMLHLERIRASADVEVQL